MKSKTSYTKLSKNIFRVLHSGKQENDKEEIFIMNADGNKKTRLTKAEYWDGSPEITPDGNYILFHSRRSDMMESGICIMKLDGSGEKVLSKVGTYPIACR